MSGKAGKPDNVKELFKPEELSELAKFAMDNAPDSVIWVNHEGRIVYVNETALKYLGYSREELLRMTIFDIDPDFPAEQYEAHKEYMRKHKWHQFESRHRAKDGRIFPVEVSTNYNEYKGQYLSIASDRDISERKKAEAALKASEEKYRTIFNNAPIGVFQTTVDGRVVEVNPTLARMYGAVDPEEMMVLIQGRAEALYADPSRRKDFIDALLESPEFQTMEIEFQRKNGSTFPAILNASIRMDDNGEPAFLDGTIEDITERKRAEEDLREREALLAEVSRLARIGGWDIDLVAQKATWSLEFFRIMEIPTTQKPPSFKEFQSFIHPEDRPVVVEAMERAMNHGQSFDLEARCHTTTGKLIWTRGIGHPAIENGKCVRVSGTIQDITEKKQAEEELRKREALLTEVSHVAKIGGWEFDMIAGKATWSLEFYRIMEISPDQEPPSPEEFINRYICPEARSKVLETLKRAVKHGESVDLEYPICTSNDKLIWARSIGHPVFEDGKCVRLFGAIQDITEKKQAEEDLRKREALLAEASRMAQFGGWEFDLGTGKASWSRETYRIMEVPADQEPPGSEEFQGRLRPEDRPRVAEAMERAINHGQSFDMEHQIQTFKDNLIWARSIGHPVYEDGKCVRLFGAIQDITEKKQAEEALRLSEEKYRAIFNNTPVGVFRNAFNGRIVDVNPAMVRMFGFTDKNELMAAIDFQAGNVYADPAVRDKFIKDLLKSPEGLFSEIEFKRPDGTAFLGFVYISVQFDADGKPAFLDGTIEDITERKRAEKALRLSEEKFSTLFRHSPDSISLLDLETGAIVDANEAFVRRAARPREEVIGRTTEELDLLVSNDDRDKFWAQLTREGRVESFEADFANEQGESGTFSVSGAKVEIEGRPYILTIGRDVTAIKRMQEMMVQTEKMLSVGGIAAGVAHEINNPLGIVLQAAQNLELRSRPDFHKNKTVADELGLDLNLMAKYMRARKLDVFIEDIRYAAQRASVIIRHLLNFSRRSESRRSVCGLKTIINGAIALANSDFDLRKSYDFKKIDLKISMDKDLPEIHCTETEIEQVILNLLRNAAQAMAEADPPIEKPRIDIRVTSRDGWIRLEVEDNGPGMSKELQQRVFEPFFTTKGPGVGTGLGLSVSYFIITTGHSGNFTVASTPGSGTLFTIELPTETTREALR